MGYEFRWNAWNVEHIAEHGVTPEEVEALISGSQPPFPRKIGRQKFLVRGRTGAGEYLQAIFIVDPEKTLYVIHARPISETERRQFRRSRR